MSKEMLKKRKAIRASVGDKMFYVIAYAVFTLLMLVCAYPFYYLMIATVSENHMVEIGQVTLWPIGFHLDNYIKVLRVENLMNSAKNSVVRTALGTGLGVLCTTYMAYFFTKEDMWARKFWYRLIVVTMYFSAGLIPGYLNNRMLGLLNTFAIYIIPGLISTYNMILVKTSIEAMPAELEESAYLDGAGYVRRLAYIVMPLQMPIIATIGLFVAVGHWNDFFTTKLNITSPSLYTLQFQLYELLQQVITASSQIDTAVSSADQSASISPASIRMTLTAIVLIPIILVYPFIQRYYVKGIMIGAVKG